MSAYKRLNSSDAVVLPYEANKKWESTACGLSSLGILVYTGKKMTGSFDSKKEYKHSGEYERLIYDQINHLYYQEFSGSYLDNTSNLVGNSYENSSIYRASGSYYNTNIGGEMVKDFPKEVGQEIKVIRIPNTLAGTGMMPDTLEISASSYHFVDDSKGNLYDISGSASGSLVGNIFYKQSLLVITNQSYQDIFPVPPSAVDDYYSFKKTTPNKKTYPLLNDSARNWTTLTGSIELSGSNSSYFTVNGDGSVSFNLSESGHFPVYYRYSAKSPDNGCVLESNYALLDVFIKFPDCNFEITVEEV